MHPAHATPPAEGERPSPALRFGDELVVRATNERVFLITRLDVAGNLLVGRPGEEPFQVHEDEVMTLTERHGGCGCCG